MKQAAYAYDEENIKYLRGFLGDEKIDTFCQIREAGVTAVLEDWETYKSIDACLEQMGWYGDNRWWTGNDMKVLAYYQLLTPIMLVPFDKFQVAFEFLAGRPVLQHEFAFNLEGLKKEAERAFKGL